MIPTGAGGRAGRPGWGRGAAEIPAAGGPRAPTSHLGSGGRGGTQSERLRPPRSADGSPSTAAAPRGRPSAETRGVSGQGKDPGPLRSPPRSPRSHSTSPPNRKKPIRSSRSSSAAAPSARGRPRGSMAAGGSLRAGLHPGLRAPSRSLRIGKGSRRGSALGDGARRPPGPPSRSESPPHLFQRPGDPDLPLPEAGRGAGEGGGSAGQPRPQPGFRFHLRLAEPKGAGRPQGVGGGGRGGLAPPPAPASDDHPPKPGRNPGNPQDVWRERGQPPRKAQSRHLP